jgi:serine/threonine-protein kinase
MEKNPAGSKGGSPPAGKPGARLPQPADATTAPTPEATETSAKQETQQPVGRTEVSPQAGPSDEASALDPNATTAPEDRPESSARAGAPTEAHPTQDFDDGSGGSMPGATKPLPPGTRTTGGDTGPKITTLGDYRLLKKLGQGGMGTVYKAHQVSLDRDVAIKVLAKELAAQPAFVQRFIREARVMAKLDHANILRCFEVGEAHGWHYLAMEYIEGGSLEGWLKKLGKFEVGDALCVLLECARGLQHAHELKLVHRDIKPGNILLTKRGVIKVADLGLAKAQDDNLGLTKTGTGAGTPVYMAPEQARDAKHVDGRSDIYALGCMLYTFVAGQPPFRGETLVELIEAKEKGKHTPARQFNVEVPQRLDLILDKMLAPKPEHRYQTCAEVIMELETLGLANARLSFLPPADPSQGHVPSAAKKPAGRAAHHAVISVAPPPAHEEEGKHWYWKVQAKGKSSPKKLTHEEVLGLLKHGSFDADTEIGRQPRGPYRALGTYPEFETHMRAKITQAKAEKKGRQFHTIYDQLVKEDERRRRWRWLHNLVLRVGGFVGLIIWLAIIAAFGVGAFFLIRYGVEWLGGQVPGVK